MPPAVQTHPKITYLLDALPASAGALFLTKSPTACVPVVGAAVVALFVPANRPSVIRLIRTACSRSSRVRSGSPLMRGVELALIASRPL